MRKVRAIVDLLIEFGGIATGKVYMQLKGMDCGDVRSPLAALDAACKKQVLSKAREILA